MNTAITVRESRKLEREAALTRLAEIANRAHDGFIEAARVAVTRALEAGRALLEARDICPKGTWTTWLVEHFGASSTTAHDYMSVAMYVGEMGNDPGCVAGLSYKEVLRLARGRSRSKNRLPAGQEPPSVAVLTSQPAEAAQKPESGHRVERPSSVAAKLTTEKGGDPFAPIVRLLEQAVVESRSLDQTGAHEASYARHLLKLLEPICRGIPDRLWFWHWIEP
jgi:hypothetical protein